MDIRLRVESASCTGVYIIFFPVLGAVEEDDVFQCGKCKKQFNSLSTFVSHKQTRCTVPATLSTANLAGLRSATGAGGAATAVVQTATANNNAVYTASVPSPLKQVIQLVLCILITEIEDHIRKSLPIITLHIL